MLEFEQENEFEATMLATVGVGYSEVFVLNYMQSVKRYICKQRLFMRQKSWEIIRAIRYFGSVCVGILFRC